MREAHAGRLTDGTSETSCEQQQQQEEEEEERLQWRLRQRQVA